MRSYIGWLVSAGMLLALPVWAWDTYGSHPGYGGTRALQLQTDIRNLERRVRDLQREVERLRTQSDGRRSGPTTNYPLPGPVTRGFQPTREGAYELSLNGVTLRIGRNGDLDIRAAGALRLEGETIVSTARAENTQ